MQFRRYHKCTNGHANEGHVFDGPVFKKGKAHKTIGNNKVVVPDYFFKVIYAPEKIKGDKVIAFIMPNARVNKKDIAKYRVSLKEVQERLLQFKSLTQFDIELG